MESAYEVRLKCKDGKLRNRRMFAKTEYNAKARVGSKDRVIGIRKVQIDDILYSEVEKIKEVVRKDALDIRYKKQGSNIIMEDTTIDSLVFKKKEGGIKKRENIEKFGNGDMETITDYLK